MVLYQQLPAVVAARILSVDRRFLSAPRAKIDKKCHTFRFAACQNDNIKLACDLLTFFLPQPCDRQPIQFLGVSLS